MTHLNYYLDLCIEAFIVNEDAVLLRLHDKYNIWTGPGGHIDPGEDSNQAVKREALEEAGLEIELVGPIGWKRLDTDTNLDLVPPIFVNRHKINDHHEHSAFIFAARSTTREVKPHEDEAKDVEFVWLNQAELDEMMKSDSRLRKEVYRYATTALKLCTNQT